MLTKEQKEWIAALRSDSYQQVQLNDISSICVKVGRHFIDNLEGLNDSELYKIAQKECSDAN